MLDVVKESQCDGVERVLLKWTEQRQTEKTYNVLMVI